MVMAALPFESAKRSSGSPVRTTPPPGGGTNRNDRTVDMVLRPATAGLCHLVGINRTPLLSRSGQQAVQGGGPLASVDLSTSVIPPGPAPQSVLTISAIFSPASVGLLTTWTPAAVRASILAWAVPLDPEMMAPAWPIFLPSGAVTPAM
jgi:hypothetical protein